MKKGFFFSLSRARAPLDTHSRLDLSIAAFFLGTSPLPIVDDSYNPYMLLHALFKEEKLTDSSPPPLSTAAQTPQTRASRPRACS